MLRKSGMPDSVENAGPPEKHDVVGAVHQFLQPFNTVRHTGPSIPISNFIETGAQA